MYQSSLYENQPSSQEHIIVEVLLLSCSAIPEHR